MEFHIEFYNTAASLGWSVVVFLLGGMLITRKKGK
jgi:hypothetical protein